MTKITDEQIRAWVDGELSADRSAEIAASVAVDSELSAKAASFEASKLPYKAAMGSGIPPVPEALRDQVAQWSQIAGSSTVSGVPERKNRHYWPNAAAAVLAMCVISWGGISYFKSSDPVQSWTNAIVSYQNFYVAETVSHITGDRVAAAITLSDLKQRYSNFPSSPPDLSAQGYAFKRLQRLDFADQPVLQMVFYKAGKRPLAICLMPDGADIKAQFTQHDLLNSYVWQSGKLRAIVVAEEGPEALKDIAEMIDA